ncbi:hypothetical protein HG619_05040 [Pseudomonas syringae]|nr:hypothetical protein [Pseudomonas syringae]
MLGAFLFVVSMIVVRDDRSRTLRIRKSVLILAEGRRSDRAAIRIVREGFSSDDAFSVNIQALSRTSEASPGRSHALRAET